MGNRYYVEGVESYASFRKHLARPRGNIIRVDPSPSQSQFSLNNNNAYRNH